MNAPDSSPPPSCCSGSPSCTAALVLGIIALVLQNQEQLKRLRDAEDSSPADETGSQDL